MIIPDRSWHVRNQNATKGFCFLGNFWDKIYCRTSPVLLYYSLLFPIFLCFFGCLFFLFLRCLYFLYFLCYLLFVFPAFLLAWFFAFPLFWNLPLFVSSFALLVFFSSALLSTILFCFSGVCCSLCTYLIYIYMTLRSHFPCHLDLLHRILVIDYITISYFIESNFMIYHTHHVMALHAMNEYTVLYSVICILYICSATQSGRELVVFCCLTNQALAEGPLLIFDAKLSPTSAAIQIICASWSKTCTLPFMWSN